MGLMPARASPSRPLVSVTFGSLSTPRRFAVPCGPPLNASLFRAGLCAPRSRARCMAFKPRRKEHHMSKTDNRPSHRVYAVTKNGERSFWQPIGAAWVHSDGWGFNLKLDYLPLNGAEIASRRSKRPTHRQAKPPDPSGPPSGGPTYYEPEDSFGRAVTGQLVMYSNFKFVRLPKTLAKKITCLLYTSDAADEED